MRDILFPSITLLGLLFLFPHISFSANTDTGTDFLEKHLTALESYITRTYGTPAQKPLTPTELRSSIKLGTHWLIRAQEPNGHFKYEYVPFEGTYNHGDNVVRQTGALYALGEVLRNNTDDPYRVSESTLRAITFFQDNSKSVTHNGRNFLCVAQSPTGTKCQLGATSLALIGILDYLIYAPDKEPAYRKEIEGYLSFILAMQKEHGGFQDTYRIGKEVQDQTESAFSNGEALLALSRYYRFDKDAGVKTAIETAFTYLANQPYDVNLYLWIMSALRDMQELLPNEKYVPYANAFTEWRAERNKPLKNSKRNYCAYAEGLAGALGVLKNNIKDTEYQVAQNELDRLNQTHLNLQISVSDEYRLLPQEDTLTLSVLKEPEQAIGGFLTSDTEPVQRIDFTQHCINTFLQTLTDQYNTSL